MNNDISGCSGSQYYKAETLEPGAQNMEAAPQFLSPSSVRSSVKVVDSRKQHFISLKLNSSHTSKLEALAVVPDDAVEINMKKERLPVTCPDYSGAEVNYNLLSSTIDKPCTSQSLLDPYAPEFVPGQHGARDEKVTLIPQNQNKRLRDKLMEISDILIETRVRDMERDEVQIVTSLSQVLLDWLDYLEQSNESQEAICGSQKGWANQLKVLVDGSLGQIEKPNRKTSVQYKFSEDHLISQGGRYRHKMGNEIATLVNALENKGMLAI